MSTSNDDNPYSSDPQQPNPEQPNSQQPYPEQPYPEQPYPQQYGPDNGGYQGSHPAMGQVPAGAANYAPPPAPPGNTAGVVSLVAAVVSFVLCPFVAGIVAMIYGRKSQKLEAAGEATNGALGSIGFWLGLVNVAITVLLALLVIAIAVTIGFAGVALA